MTELEKRKMNMKKIMSLAAILMIILSSCGNGKSKEAEIIAMSADSLASVSKTVRPEFENAVKNKTYAYDLIQNEKVKKEITNRYGEKYYAELVKYTQVSSIVTYDKETDTFISEGFEKGNPDTYARLTLKYTDLDTELVVNGNPVQSDGNYAVGDWEMGYFKNEFNEDDHNRAYVDFRNSDGKYSIAIRIMESGILMRPHHRDDIISYKDVQKISVRHNETGEVFEYPFQQVEGGSAYISNGEAVIDFISLLKHNDITISLTRDEGDNCVVRIDHERSKYVEGAILRHILKRKVY